MHAHIGKLTYCPRNPGALKVARWQGGRVASPIKHLPLNWGSSGVGIRATLRNFSDRQLSALHARTGRCSLEGGDFNSMHTLVASGLTAMSVLKGKKEVKKRKRDLQPVSLWAAQWRRRLCAQWWAELRPRTMCRGWRMRCRNIVMPFYKSVVHPYFECSSQGQLSYLKEDINERVKGQQRAVELIRGIGLRWEQRWEGGSHWQRECGWLELYITKICGAVRDQGKGKWSNEGLPKGQVGVPIYLASWN